MKFDTCMQKADLDTIRVPTTPPTTTHNTTLYIMHTKVLEGGGVNATLLHITVSNYIFLFYTQVTDMSIWKG